jgi:hypothetical protein
VKKLIILSFLFSSCILSLNAQWGDVSKKELDKLKNSTMLVVLKGEESFISSLKKAIEDNWTFTKFEFVTESEVQKKFVNKEEVFLFGYFTGDFSSYKYTLKEMPVIGIAERYLTKGKYKIQGDIKICYPYPFEGIESQYLDAYLKVYVQLLNNYLELLNAPDSKVKSMYAYYIQVKTRNKLCRDKKLLICEEDNYLTDDVIKSIYKGDYEIVKRERINKAILNREDVLIYYLIPSVYYSYYTIFSASDVSVYFNNFGITGEREYKVAQKRFLKELNNAE